MKHIYRVPASRQVGTREGCVGNGDGDGSKAPGNKETATATTESEEWRRDSDDNRHNKDRAWVALLV